MKIKKADWFIVREAEEAGNMVSMSGEPSRNRTPLNNELMKYFRGKMPSYLGFFNEDEGEDILYSINDYMDENKIDKYPLYFPISGGSDIHLIPITDNLQLKVIVADEYYGDGEYSKYVMSDYFMINENTTTDDVDKLIEFVKAVLNQN